MVIKVKIKTFILSLNLPPPHTSNFTRRSSVLLKMYLLQSEILDETQTKIPELLTTRHTVVPERLLLVVFVVSMVKTSRVITRSEVWFPRYMS